MVSRLHIGCLFQSYRNETDENHSMVTVFGQAQKLHQRRIYKLHDEEECMEEKKIYLCGDCMKVIAFGTMQKIRKMRLEDKVEKCGLCGMERGAVLCTVVPDNA